MRNRNGILQNPIPVNLAGKVYNQYRYICGRYSADTACLSDGLRFYLAQFFTCFERKGFDLIVIEVASYFKVFVFAEAVDDFLFFKYVALVFDEYLRTFAHFGAYVLVGFGNLFFEFGYAFA